MVWKINIFGRLFVAVASREIYWSAPQSFFCAPKASFCIKTTAQEKLEVLDIYRNSFTVEPC